MQLRGSAVEVVERAYDIESPTPRWLESIRESAERAFSGQLAVQAYTFLVSATGNFGVGHIASDPAWRSVLERAHASAEPAVIREVYLRGPVRNVVQAVAGNLGDPGYQEVVRSGIGNVTLALGIDPGGRGAALVFLQPKRRPAQRLRTRPVRQTLERIAAHLACAYRLRGRDTDESKHPGDDDTRVDEATRGEDAVLTAGGDLLHAVGDARDPESRSALREAARRIDRARSRRGGADPEQALGLWRALVDGRWSLVERFESDGRRILIARRNDPTAGCNRGLSEQERKIVALLALGHSLKMCAYELGRAESTVSELARSALRKMGITGRSELVEIHGAIVRAKGTPPPPSSSGSRR